MCQEPSKEKDQITEALENLYPMLGRNPLDSIVENFGGHSNISEVEVKCNFIIYIIPE